MLVYILLILIAGKYLMETEGERKRPKGERRNDRLIIRIIDIFSFSQAYYLCPWVRDEDLDWSKIKCSSSNKLFVIIFVTDAWAACRIQYHLNLITPSFYFYFYIRSFILFRDFTKIVCRIESHDICREHWAVVWNIFLHTALGWLFF